jgi:transposase InsO family protein
LSIRECISDHGTQFFADKRDKQGNADHVFEVFLEAQGVKQILCGVNHPQTNGKVEKWFDFYRHHRDRYAIMAALVDWYNDRMHGGFNVRVCGSFNQVFIREVPLECWMLMAEKLFKW